jgi:antitoxin VapB
MESRWLLFAFVIEPKRKSSYCIYMKTAKLFSTGGSQAVRLPKEFRFEGDEVFVEREGDTVILKPKTKRRWPKNFFNAIHISDPKFKRLPQGKLPSVPEL